MTLSTGECRGTLPPFQQQRSNGTDYWSSWQRIKKSWNEPTDHNAHFARSKYFCSHYIHFTKSGFFTPPIFCTLIQRKITKPRFLLLFLLTLIKTTTTTLKCALLLFDLNIKICFELIFLEWINFFKHFFGGFYILLWVEASICFAAYAWKASGTNLVNYLIVPKKVTLD